LLSIAQAIERHGEPTKVVVSDTSPESELDATGRLVRGLPVRSSLLQLHYYSCLNWGLFIAHVLAQSTQIEKDAFAYLIPADGHWGADRNKLSLLAVRHGGSAATYLHLDDDILLPRVDDNANHGCGEGTGDVLGLFEERFRIAAKSGKVGYASGVAGTPDGFVSHGRNRGLSKHQVALTAPQRKVLSLGLGPGRIAGFACLQEPYRPYGLDEDICHGRAFGKQPYLTDDMMDGVCSLYVQHFGKEGVRREAKRCYEYGAIPPRIRQGWRYLVERVAHGETEGKGTGPCGSGWC
jgi:hypothetical protein